MPLRASAGGYGAWLAWTLNAGVPNGAYQRGIPSEDRLLARHDCHTRVPVRDFPWRLQLELQT